MQTLKVMSIIGMVLFSLAVMLVGASEDIDIELSLGAGAWAAIYGLAFSITTFVQARKHGKKIA